MANLPICSRAGRTSRTIDFKGGQYPNYGASMDVYPWETGRLRRVTEMVAEKSGWGKRNHGKGTGIGIAAHRSFLTYVATVVEVEVDDQGEVRIPRVDTVLDAGLVVNPEATSSPVRRRRGIRHKYCAKRRDYGDQGRHRPIEFSGLSGGSDCRGALSDECIHRRWRSEEHTSELQSRLHLVCRLLLEKKKIKNIAQTSYSLYENLDGRGESGLIDGSG